MKIMAIADNYPAHPRLKKVSQYLTDEKEVTYILWDRKGVGQPAENELLFTKKSELGKKWKKVFNLLNFRAYIKKQLKENSYDAILCRHWQQLLLVKTIFHSKEVPIYYDVCDMPHSKMFRWLERRMVPHLEGIFLASRFYVKSYEKENSNVVLLENKPWHRHCSMKRKLKRSEKEKIRISFIGNIRYRETVQVFLGYIYNAPEFEFHFYGSGPDEEYLQEWVGKNGFTNVFFHGRYEEDELPNIYNETDFVWAVYDAKNSNVKRAISNKFFETLIYEVPGIFAEKTELGKMVHERDIGLTVDIENMESIECLRKKLLDRKITQKFKEKIHENWGETLFFDDYIKNSPYR